MPRHQLAVTRDVDFLSRHPDFVTRDRDLESWDPDFVSRDYDFESRNPDFVTQDPDLEGRDKVGIPTSQDSDLESRDPDFVTGDLSKQINNVGVVFVVQWSWNDTGHQGRLKRFSLVRFLVLLCRNSLGDKARF